MNSQDRKFQQRVARRREKVLRLIEEQKTRLTVLNSTTFLREQDYYDAVNTSRRKLNRLEQELNLLEEGHLPGNWC